MNELQCWNCDKDSGIKSNEMIVSVIQNMTENMKCKNCSAILIKAKKKYG